MHNSAHNDVTSSAHQPQSFVLCVGVDTDLCSKILHAVGPGVAVLVVGDTASAWRLLAPDDPSDEPTECVMEFGSLRIDVGAREAWWDGRFIELSTNQFDLLVILAGDGGRAWSFAELTTAVWNRPFLGDIDVVASAVKRLRRRLARVTKDLAIVSVRGVGYRLSLLPTMLRPTEHTEQIVRTPGTSIGVGEKQRAETG